jgi:protein disulfide-isomerase
MKCCISFLFALGIICFHPMSFAAPPSINWFTNYEKAVQESQNSSKPIILFFTGSDWCSWCIKLEEEAFDTKEFAQTTSDKFIFLKLDFPLYKSIDQQISRQNKALQKKYNIRGFPTIILLDSNLQEVGETGYRPGGGKEYAEHLLKIINSYAIYQQNMLNLETQSLSGLELKSIYNKSCELGLYNDSAKIIKVGLQSDMKQFFQMEQYRNYASEGLIHKSEAIAMKKKLIAADPKNEQLIPYQIAVIEFEAYSEEMEKENYAPEFAIAPLVDYINKFGEKDKNNLWRLQMIISQVYLDKNKFFDALKYAKASYESAPASVQPEIAIAVKNIQSQLK